MSELRFTDGVTIKTDGLYRVIHLRDGYYVVGHGMCLPVDDREEGKDVIRELEAVRN